LEKQNLAIYQAKLLPFSKQTKPQTNTERTPVIRAHRRFPAYRAMIRSFQNLNPRIHETAFIAENAVIIGDVEIGEDSSVWYGSVLRGDVNYIRIGARTNIQDACVLHVTARTHPTVLEDEITLGHRVTLHGCYVETGCLIGIGAIVMDGVRVGRNSLVGAGSLVTPNIEIPPRSLVLGSPARVQRELSNAEVKDLERFWQSYVSYNRIYRGEE
jgi:gamma-carbonic anhydrase